MSFAWFVLQDSVSSKFRPMEELKKDMAQLDLLVETDVQVPQRQGEKNNATNTLFVCFGHIGGHVTSVFV